MCCNNEIEKLKKLFKFGHYIDFLDLASQLLKKYENSKYESTEICELVTNLLEYNKIHEILTLSILKNFQQSIESICNKEIDGIKSLLDDEEVFQQNNTSSVGKINVVGYDIENKLGVVFKFSFETENQVINSENNEAEVDNTILEKPIGIIQILFSEFTIDKIIAPPKLNIIFWGNPELIKKITGNSYELGIAIAYYSYITSQEIPDNLAVTGELDAKKKLCKIDNLNEKIKALRNYPRITKFIYPNANNEEIQQDGQEITFEKKGCLNQVLESVFGNDTLEEAKNHLRKLQSQHETRLEGRGIDNNSIRRKGLKDKNVIERNEFIDNLIKKVNNKIKNGSDKNIICITGEAGIGKSQTQYELLKKLRTDSNNDNLIIIPYFFSSEFKENVFYYRANLELNIYRRNKREESEDSKTEFINLLNDADEHPIIILADGLDEIEKRHKKFIESLINLKGKNIIIVFSYQEKEELNVLFESVPKEDKLLLSELKENEIKELFECELKGGRLNKSSEEENELLLIKKIRTLFQESKGNPLYLELFFEANKDEENIDFNNLGTGLEEYIEKLYQRLQSNQEEICNKYLKFILPLLAVSKEPLNSETIKNILKFQDTSEQISEKISHANLFVFKDDSDRLQFKNPLFQRGFIQTKLVESLKNTNEKIIKWCQNWRKNNDEYALKHYAEHLIELESFNKLYELCKNKAFFERQLKIISYSPEAILKTTALALEASFKKNELLKITELTFLYAERSQILYKSPLYIFDNSQNNKLKAAFAYILLSENVSDQQIWRLILYWKLLIENKQNSEDVINLFLKIQGYRSLPNTYYKHIFLAIIPHLIIRDEQLICKIKFLNSEEITTIAKILWEHDKIDLAEKMIQKLKGKAKSDANREFGRYLLTNNEYKKTISIIYDLRRDDPNKYWLQCDLALSYVTNDTLKYTRGKKKGDKISKEDRIEISIRNANKYIPNNWHWQKCTFWLELALLDTQNAQNYLEEAKKHREKIDKNSYMLFFINSKISIVLFFINQYKDAQKSFNSINIALNEIIIRNTDSSEKFRYLQIKITILKYFIKSIKSNQKIKKHIYQDVKRAITSVWDRIYELENENIPFKIFTGLTEIYFELGKVYLIYEKIAKKIPDKIKVYVYQEIISRSIAIFKDFDIEKYIKGKYKKLRILDNTLAFYSAFILKTGFSEPSKVIGPIEEKLIKTNTKLENTDWGEARVLGELATYFFKKKQKEEANNCIKIAKESINNIRWFNSKIYSICNLLESTNEYLNENEKEEEIKFLLDSTKNNIRLKIIVTKYLIKINYNNEIVEDQIKNVILLIENEKTKKRTKTIEDKIHLYIELLEIISNYNNTEILEEVTGIISEKLNDIIKSQDTNSYSIFVGKILQAIMKSFVLNYPKLIEQKLELFKNFEMLAEKDEVKENFKNTDEYYRANVVFSTYEIYRPDNQDGQEKFEAINKIRKILFKIQQDKAKAKTLKDLSILLMHLGKYDEAFEYASLITSQVSEHIPDIISTYLSLSKEYREDMIYLYIKASQFYDASYRMIASLIKNKLQELDNAKKLEGMMKKFVDNRKKRSW